MKLNFHSMVPGNEIRKSYQICQPHILMMSHPHTHDVSPTYPNMYVEHTSDVCGTYIPMWLPHTQNSTSNMWQPHWDVCMWHIHA